MAFTHKKAKWKSTVKHHQNKNEVRVDDRKQSCRVSNWMKVIFSNELSICIGQDPDAETFLCCHSNETYKDDYLNKTNRFPKPWFEVAGKTESDGNYYLNACVHLNPG